MNDHFLKRSPRRQRDPEFQLFGAATFLGVTIPSPSVCAARSDVAHKQKKPNPYVALEGHGFPIHCYGLDGHQAEESHSTCGVVVADTEPLFDAFATGLRARYGKLPVSGHPRIIRIQLPGSGPAVESSPLRESLLNAIVLADSKGDSTQAAKILRGAVRRADPADAAMAEAMEFLDELDQRSAVATRDH